MLLILIAVIVTGAGVMLLGLLIAGTLFSIRVRDERERARDDARPWRIWN